MKVKVHDEEAAPRYLEDEGLYVGRRPFVLDKSLHKMENRLIKEGDQVRAAARVRHFGRNFIHNFVSRRCFSCSTTGHLILICVY